MEPDQLSDEESLAAIAELEELDRRDERSRKQMREELDRIAREQWPRGFDLVAHMERGYEPFGAAFSKQTVERAAFHIALDFARGAERFAKGDRKELLLSLVHAASIGVPIPAWCVQPLCEAFDAYEGAAVKTLGEAFGVVRPKNFRQDAVRLKAQFLPLAISIMQDNRDKRIRNGMGKPEVSDKDFEAAAEQLHLTKETMRAWWREFLSDVESRD